MEHLCRRGHSTLTRTASAIRPQEWRVESRLLGEFLGEDLKDEYPHKGLTQYVGLGAKNYAIRFTDDTSECKVRGFTLNYQTSKMIDFDTMLEMLQKKPLSLSYLWLFFVWACVLILSFPSRSTMHSPAAKRVKRVRRPDDKTQCTRVYSILSPPRKLLCNTDIFSVGRAKWNSPLSSSSGTMECKAGRTHCCSVHFIEGWHVNCSASANFCLS